VVIRGPNCILEGALRFATARFGEGMDRWSVVRERLTHVVDVTNSPCACWKRTTDHEAGQKDCRKKLTSRKTTSVQSSTTTVLERSFCHALSRRRPDRELWLHEDCGHPGNAEHDLGMILIGEEKIPTGRVCAMLKVKLDISEEGLLLSKPTLEMSNYAPNNSDISLSGAGLTGLGVLPITWEGANLSLSDDSMDTAREQLAEEMKTLHIQPN
jgi:hypothetical protein